MNVTRIPMATRTIGDGFSRVRGLIRKRKRIAIAVFVAALLLPPLALTANIMAFLLNATILGGAALLVWRFATALRGRRRKR